MALEGRLLPAAFEAASVRYRRILVIARSPAKGRLTEPIAGAQSGCDLGPPSATRAIRQSRRLAGQELCGAFWPGIRAGNWGRPSVTANHGALSTINACAS